MRGYLYIADETGAEIPGSRRSLEHIERGDRRFLEIKYDLQRLAGEGCLVRWSEEE